MNNIPTSPNDPVNTDILLVAEDRIKGFRRLRSEEHTSELQSRE